MSKTIDQSRRRFFLKGSAALGAGLASGTAAAGLLEDEQQLKAELAAARSTLARQEVEAFRTQFIEVLTRQEASQAASYFAVDSLLQLPGLRLKGQAEVEAHLRECRARAYGKKTDIIVAEMERDEAGHGDRIEVHPNCLLAEASFHYRVLLGRPLAGESSLEQMAMQQGQLEQRQWQRLRMDLRLRKQAGQWIVEEAVSS